MTPPRYTRNFILGTSHAVPDLGLNPEVTQRRLTGNSAIHSSMTGEEISRSEAADQVLIAPTERYRPSLVQTYEEYSDVQLQQFIHQSLVSARAGERVSYYDALASHFALLMRSNTERIAPITRQFLSTVQEYSNFLQYMPDLSTEERLRYLFAAARILHTYLGYFQRPPLAITLPENREQLRTQLASALDELDAQMQEYHRQLVTAGSPEVPRLVGVRAWIDFRRSMHGGDRDAQRRDAMALAEYLRAHPPAALDTSWEARAERGLLEDPHIIEQLRRLDVPAQIESQALGLNAFSLELTVLAAASLDRANEEPEASLRQRYGRLSAVLTAVMLRHPESCLEDLLSRLRQPAEQASLIAEMDTAQLLSAEVAQMLREARGQQGLAELLITAREAAEHIQALSSGLGRNLLPGILAANRGHQPIVRLDAELTRLPELREALHLPSQNPGRELLRRGALGRAQLREFQALHPQMPLQSVLTIVGTGSERISAMESTASELFEEWQSRISSAPDHESFALYSLFHALEENRGTTEIPGLSESLRNQAAGLRGRMEGFEFRSRRVLGHLFSASNLVTLGAGILATEFLPTLLISRAGAVGSLSLRGLRLVSEGQLTGWGSALTGIGTGLSLSALGSTMNNIQRSRIGLTTHWSRDFLSSSAINLATFGLTIPASALLRQRLMALGGEARAVGALGTSQRLLLHGGTVAMGGGIAWGLGYLGRGIGNGQWQVSGEEIAENVGSILLWEGGAAGLRWARSYRNPSAQLGAYRAEHLQRLVANLVERNPRLVSQREAISTWLGREELRMPGTLQRFQAGFDAHYVPVLRGSGRRMNLSLIPLDQLPPPPAPNANEARAANDTQAAAQPADERIFVLDLQDDKVLRMTADAESLRDQAAPAPAAEQPRPRSEPPEGHPPLVAFEESSFSFEVRTNAESGENSGQIDFYSLPTGETEGTHILGRGAFPFLSAQMRRSLSRHHLELRIGNDGRVYVRNLSHVQGLENGSEVHGSWCERNGELAVIPSNVAVPLEAGEIVALGNRHDPVRFRIPENFSAPLSRVSLPPGGRLRVNGLVLLRSGGNSEFRLMGSGETPITVTRGLGSEAGTPRVVPASMNPVVGEIGELSRISIGEGADRRTYQLFFDAPDLPAGFIPQVEIHYSGVDKTIHFRSTHRTLDFGRIHQPDLFTAPFISRNHFRLAIGAHEGNPRYLLRVESPYGLMVSGQHHPHGTVLGLYSGFYQLQFPMEATGRAYDAPFQMRLAPIHANFPEWNIGELLPNHDNAVAPLPPPLPPPPEPAAPTPQQPPARPRPFWERWFS